MNTVMYSGIHWHENKRNGTLCSSTQDVLHNAAARTQYITFGKADLKDPATQMMSRLNVLSDSAPRGRGGNER